MEGYYFDCRCKYHNHWFFLDGEENLCDLTIKYSQQGDSISDPRFSYAVEQYRKEQAEFTFDLSLKEGYRFLEKTGLLKYGLTDDVINESNWSEQYQNYDWESMWKEAETIFDESDELGVLIVLYLLASFGKGWMRNDMDGDYLLSEFIEKEYDPTSQQKFVIEFSDLPKRLVL